MKFLFNKIFPAIAINSSRLVVWFTLAFFSITSNVFATDYPITVTNSGSTKYIFNALVIPGTNEVYNNTLPTDLTVVVGDVITFDVSSVSTAHPFAIVDELSSSNQYLAENKVSGVTNNGLSGASEVVWDLSDVDPGEYYYICTLHPSMRGKITVYAAGTNDGNLFGNGSLIGIPEQSLPNLALPPNSWSLIKQNNIEIPQTATADIVDINGNGSWNDTWHVETPSNSSNGGTWVGMYATKNMQSTNPNAFDMNEGIYQQVSLSANQTYTISFEMSHFAAFNTK